MLFGPLEMQACGENNFTMKALGFLAFRPDLRARFVQKLAGAGALSPEDGEVSMLFFTRIGEGFFREAIERERDAERGEFEARLNKALDLPDGFLWRRNKDGRLTQPAKWQSSHINDMLRLNRSLGDQGLHDRLAYLQDCVNTEPDIVLQWGRKLALVEIKVLSSEGSKQLDRQMRLGQLLSCLLGWEAPLFFLVGPGHGGRPKCSGWTFFSWEEVANWFSDVPDIVDYIRSFAFFYHGRWQSMVSAKTAAPGKTAYDLMGLNPPENPPRSPPDPWHFSHLGSQYFLKIFLGCRKNGVWPLRWIWVGTTGVPFAKKSKGQQVNPNWMVEDEHGQRRTKTSGFEKEGKYDEGHMRRFSHDDVVQYFNLP
jgi:hypothetical protein